MTAVMIQTSALEAEIMNMMIICSFTACEIDDPPRMAPVIMPGMAMIPMTLTNRVSTLMSTA